MPKITLQKQLSKSGYDLIDGPLRNHKPLQIWIKKDFDPAELYYEHILHAFKSDVKLELKKDASLVVDESLQSTYNLNIGLTLLKQIFQNLGLQPVDLDAVFRTGKKISISYKNAYSESIPLGKLIELFQEADFVHPNNALLQHANRNRLLIITGVLSAEHLEVECDTDTRISGKQLISLNKSMKNKVDFSLTKNKKVRMTAGIARMPIAVKVGKIDFDKGVFSNIDLVTDARNFF